MFNTVTKSLRAPIRTTSTTICSVRRKWSLGSTQKHQRVQITKEYDEKRAAAIALLDKQDWQAALHLQRQLDLRINPNVRVNLLELIVALGMSTDDGSLERLLQKPDIRILDFFMSSTSKMKNKTGKALLFAMIDFAPELEQSRVLMENLMTYCQFLDPRTDVS